MCNTEEITISKQIFEIGTNYSHAIVFDTGQNLLIS